MIFINDTDTYHDTIVHKLIELPILYVKIISFLGIKCIQTVNMFPFRFWYTIQVP